MDRYFAVEFLVNSSLLSCLVVPLLFFFHLLLSQVMKSLWRLVELELGFFPLGFV